MGYVALLFHALIDGEIHGAMRDAGITMFPLYPESRACTGPTATRVIEIFEPLSAHELLEGDAVVKCFDLSLSRLRRRILELLNVPVGAYQSSPTTAV